MTLLVADDDAVSRLRLEAYLTKHGYDVVTAEDGNEAWRIFEAGDPPGLAIIDWVMPGMNGVELCRRIRQTDSLRGSYILLLTGRSAREDILEGLRAGANDYVTKPFDPDELQARLRVAGQVVGLQNELAQRVKELEEALSQVKQLQGLLPICMYCKKIRDDQDYWSSVESYVSKRTDVHFSHGICPDCYQKIVAPQLSAMRAAEGDTKRAH